MALVKTVTGSDKPEKITKITKMALRHKEAIRDAMEECEEARKLMEEHDLAHRKAHKKHKDVLVKCESRLKDMLEEGAKTDEDEEEEGAKAVKEECECDGCDVKDCDCMGEGCKDESCECACHEGSKSLKDLIEKIVNEKR